MQSVESKVFKRIRGSGRGCVFSARRFLDLGSEVSVRKALETLTDRGSIRRLATGVYDYPRQHPKLGPLTPAPETIALAIVGRDSAKLQPSGAYAANLLGLSLQVPAQIEFLTDGTSRKFHVGKQTIVLRQTVPRTMATAGRVSGLVIQALRYLGRAHVDDSVIASLNHRLNDQDIRTLLADIPLAPAWIQKIIRGLAQARGAS